MTSTERGGSVDALGLERTVLVVDADSAIVRLVAKYLARSGFNVLTAGSAEEAIAVAQAHGGRIDLLLAEVALTRQWRGGRKLLEKAACRHSRHLYLCLPSQRRTGRTRGKRQRHSKKALSREQLGTKN